MQRVEYRPKLRSLEGVEVLLHTLDGVKIEPAVKVIFEEVSEFGLLFRSEKGHLIYASTASFTVVEND